ncbi:MAG: hypothetical protein AAGA56_16655, partial [Myxococcota bacterium]
VGDDFRITPHVRFHAQNGAVFWERAYRGARLAAGPYIQPNYRTGDRELGPLVNATGGLGFFYEANEHLAFALSGDAIYTRFLNHLYDVDRLGGFVAFLVEAKTK